MTEHIPPSQVKEFRSRMKQVFGVNVASMALGLVNELGFGHSAMGFNQLAMESVDTSMVLGLNATEKLDAKKRHRLAVRGRQALYAAHIGIALLGTAESARLINEHEMPSPANIAISTVVAGINADIIRRERRAAKEMDQASALPGTQTTQSMEIAQYRMNEQGVMSIAWTNVAESVGGLASGLEAVVPYASPVSAIVSNIAVVGIMGRQIAREEHMLRKSEQADVS